MNPTLSSQLASTLVADRHVRAAHHRLLRLAETTETPATAPPRHVPAQRRFRLRRAAV